MWMLCGMIGEAYGLVLWVLSGDTFVGVVLEIERKNCIFMMYLIWEIYMG